MTRRSSPRSTIVPRPRVVVVVVVAVEAVAVVTANVVTAVTAKVAVEAVAVVTARAVDVVNAVAVMENAVVDVAKADVAVAVMESAVVVMESAVVDATVKAVAEAVPELELMVRSSMPEVARPEEADTRASPVRKHTPWTDKTAQAVVAVVTARVETAEADGVVISPLVKEKRTRKLMPTPPKRRRRRPNVVSASPSLLKRKRRKLVSPSMTTWRRRLPTPRVSLLRQRILETERRSRIRLPRESATRPESWVSITTSHGETLTPCSLLLTPTLWVSRPQLMKEISKIEVVAAEVPVVVVVVVTTVPARPDRVDVEADVAESLP